MPDEGTFDFALMYVPSESVYYEMIVREQGNDIYDYALKKRVIPVSPNSFYAHLQVIAVGFRALKVEKNVREILNSLGRLTVEMKKLVDDFQTLGKHINNAQSKYRDVDQKLSRFYGILEQISAKGLPGEDKKAIQG